MSKTKKLIYLKNTPITSKETNIVHFDHKDEVLAYEHLGCYVMSTPPKKSNTYTSRIYLCYKAQKEYFQERRRRGEKLHRINVKPNKLHLLDQFPKYIHFIHSCIKTSIPNIMSEHLTQDFLRGLRVCLLIFDYLDIKIRNIGELTNRIQKKVIENISKVCKFKNDRYMLRYFFGKIENHVHGFVPLDIPKTFFRDKSIEAYPSSTIYQMDFYARKELDRLIERRLEYIQWISELNKKELFSLENLACTYYNPNQKNIAFKQQINLISKTLFKTDLKSWESKQKGKYTYTSDQQRYQHLNLLKLSQEGIDIEVKDERMFSLWMKTIHPDWPFDQTVDEKYRKLYTHEKSFRISHMKKINLNYYDFESRIYPGFNEIYPLILLLLIREGLNSETLQDWKITKTDEGYKLGDESPFAIIIDAEKTRSNSIITTTISKDSDQAKYIEFYLKWLSDIYEHSNEKYFFQYIARGTKIRSWLGVELFGGMKRSKYSFYKKNKLFDINGKRILHINHQKIRVSNNYMDYLHGLSEFERQLKKGHKSIETQKKYENSIEWNDQIMLKIAKTQNQYVSFFRGQILESTKKVNKLFEGVLSDCSNPFSPDYPGHKSLKANEACTDWFKCLTGCTKANVIKPIHGPAIVAWKEYMEQQQELFLRIEDWEKEYLPDYEAATSTLEGFNESEIQFSTQNAHRYVDVVKMKFAKKVKPTKKIL